MKVRTWRSDIVVSPGCGDSVRPQRRRTDLELSARGARRSPRKSRLRKAATGLRVR
ncbi:hypothetical protein [Lysobacter gummosus]|uniref:hypothetical protein n=1 Tax=Lysobacter gummosus TaxID=262324 RepID=UPI00363D9167